MQEAHFRNSWRQSKHEPQGSTVLQYCSNSVRVNGCMELALDGPFKDRFPSGGLGEGIVNPLLLHSHGQFLISQGVDNAALDCGNCTTSGCGQSTCHLRRAVLVEALEGLANFLDVLVGHKPRGRDYVRGRETGTIDKPRVGHKRSEGGPNPEARTPSQRASLFSEPECETDAAASATIELFCRFFPPKKKTSKVLHHHSRLRVHTKDV